MRKALLGALLLISITSVAGCLGNSEPKFGQIKGKITYNGKNLTSGTVVFHYEGKNGASQIGPDGSFHVKDAPIGLCKVTVTPAKNAVSAGVDPSQPYAGQGIPKNAKIPNMPPGTPINKTAPFVKPDKIPAKYADLNQTDLTCKVKEGSNSEFDITLKD